VTNCLTPSTADLGTYLRINPTDAGNTQVGANHHNHCNFSQPLSLRHQICCADDGNEVAVAASDGHLLIILPVI